MNRSNQNIIIAIIIAILILCSFTACGTQTVPNEQKNSQSEVTGITDTVQPDIDLTKMSSTMVYSEVQNMMLNADNYIGKIVKMSGLCSIFTDDQTGKSYASCVIQDATACCSQGIEYNLGSQFQCPQDYPQEGAEITVIGQFSTYYEGNERYMTLLDAKII